MSMERTQEEMLESAQESAIEAVQENLKLRRAFREAMGLIEEILPMASDRLSNKEALKFGWKDKLKQLKKALPNG